MLLLRSGSAWKLHMFIFSRILLQPWRWKQYVSLKHWHQPMKLHGTKPKTTLTFITMFPRACNWSVTSASQIHFTTLQRA
jgi:hypothetical protein